MIVGLTRPRKALLSSVNQGNISQVRKILDDAFITNLVGDESLALATVMAIRRGDPEMVKIFLDKTSMGEAEYYNALQAAFTASHDQIVQLLLEQGRSYINLNQEWCKNALSAASFEGNEKMFKLLLQKCIETYTNGDQGRCLANALEASCIRGHRNIVELLLNTEAGSHKLQDCHLDDALCTASRQGQLQIVKLLLHRGANLNTERYWFGNALQAASYKGNSKIVYLLLDRGADVTQKDTSLEQHSKQLLWEDMIALFNCSLPREQM
jgi:ankyrin repeat protein